MTLEKSFTSFLNFGIAKGLETNEESASYTEIKIKLHRTLHSFPFRNLQLAIEISDPALDPCHLRGLSKTGTVNYETRNCSELEQDFLPSTVLNFCFVLEWGDSFKQHCDP